MAIASTPAPTAAAHAGSPPSCETTKNETKSTTSEAITNRAKPSRRGRGRRRIGLHGARATRTPADDPDDDRRRRRRRQEHPHREPSEGQSGRREDEQVGEVRHRQQARPGVRELRGHEQRPLRVDVPRPDEPDHDRREQHRGGVEAHHGGDRDRGERDRDEQAPDRRVRPATGSAPARSKSPAARTASAITKIDARNTRVGRRRSSTSRASSKLTSPTTTTSTDNPRTAAIASGTCPTRPRPAQRRARSRLPLLPPESVVPNRP